MNYTFSQLHDRILKIHEHFQVLYPFKNSIELNHEYEMILFKNDSIFKYTIQSRKNDRHVLLRVSQKKEDQKLGNVELSVTDYEKKVSEEVAKTIIKVLSVEGIISKTIERLNKLLKTNVEDDFPCRKIFNTNRGTSFVIASHKEDTMAQIDLQSINHESLKSFLAIKDGRINLDNSLESQKAAIEKFQKFFHTLCIIPQDILSQDVKESFEVLKSEMTEINKKLLSSERRISPSL